MLNSYRIDNAIRHTRAIWYSSTKKNIADSYDVGFDQTYAYYKYIGASLGLAYKELGRCRELTDGSKFFRFWHDNTEFCTVPLVGTTEDKWFATQYLTANGIPSPPGRAFFWREEKAAVDFALSLGGSFVIKPAADTEGGEGVFTDLRSKAEGLAAFRRVATFAERLLVEKYVTGENFRVLIYKGKCLSVLHRQRPAVTGDGRLSIAQLVARENENRIRKNSWEIGDPPFAALRLDARVLQHLAKQHLSPSRVLAEGEVVTFSDVCNYSQGGVLRDITDDVSPAIIEGALKAAELFDTPLTGVDVIAPGPHSDDYYINEINVGPGLQMHYLLENPEQCRDPIRVILKDYFGQV